MRLKIKVLGISGHGDAFLFVCKTRRKEEVGDGIRSGGGGRGDGGRRRRVEREHGQGMLLLNEGELESGNSLAGKAPEVLAFG